MSNETFDHKIRKKVLDFEPDFEEKAWEKFSPQLVPGYKASPKINLKKWGMYSGFAAAAALIIFLSFQNYQLSQKKQPTLAEAKEEVPVENNQRLPQTEASQNPVVSVSPETLAPQPKKSVEKMALPQFNESNPGKTVSASADILSKSPQTEAPTKVYVSNIPQTRIQDTVGFSAEGIKNTPESASPLHDEKNIVVIHNPIKIKPISEKNTIQPIRISQENHLAVGTSSPDLVFGDNIPLPSVRKPIVTRRPSCSAGLSFGYMEDRTLFGVTGNIGITPKLSLNLGVDYNLIPPKAYANEVEYNLENDQQFSAIVPTNQLTGVTYLAIREEQKRWDATVSLQYRQPVFKQLSVVVNLGKRILMNSRELLSYKYESIGAGLPPKQEIQSFSHQPHNRPPGSSPVWAGIGLQYDWKRMQFGVMPQLIMAEAGTNNNRDIQFNGALQVKTAVRIF